MTRHRSVSLLALALAVPASGIGPSPAGAQSIAPPTPSPSSPPTGQAPPRPEAVLVEALRANPITAPYRIGVEARGKKLAIRGRVGSKQVHDAAVRTAIAYGFSVSDELVIDTLEATRVAAASTTMYPGSRPASILSSYTYPPPLFGRYDEPFFGLEPPLISYPAWWGEMSRVRLGIAAQDQAQAPPTTQPQPAATDLPGNTVEMTIDPLGVAVLRGNVPTEADKADVARQLSQRSDVTKIINELNVAPGANPVAGRGDDQPPPPPTPAESRPVIELPDPAGNPIRIAPAPAPRSAIPGPERRPDAPEGLSGRLDRAIGSRPELAGQGLKVGIRDGVASLSGSVPSVYEAMLAFRAVQQTPGVREVVDTLRFTVPDGTTPNPLLDKAKPEDAEPYLEAQIRRQVGDSAHLDRVRLRGDELQIQGTLERADDRARVEAILRSMPVLRGIKLAPEFRALDR